MRKTYILWPCRRLSQFFLKNLVGGKDFLWHCKPPHGRSGGMLSLPENRDFVTGTIFRESEKHTLMKNNIFHEGDVNPIAKTCFHESAPHTAMKSAAFVRVFKKPP